jgi:hypothetical protein
MNSHAFHAVMVVLRAFETGLVLTDRKIQPVILRDRIGRARVVKVQNGNGRVRLRDFLRAVRNVPGDEMLLRQRLLGLGDGLRDAIVPGLRHSAEVRLVHHLEVEIVEAVQLRDELARHLDLQREQGRLLVERIDLVFPDLCRSRSHCCARSSASNPTAAAHTSA